MSFIIAEGLMEFITVISTFNVNHFLGLKIMQQGNWVGTSGFLPQIFGHLDMFV